MAEKPTKLFDISDNMLRALEELERIEVDYHIVEPEADFDFKAKAKAKEMNGTVRLIKRPDSRTH